MLKRKDLIHLFFCSFSCIYNLKPVNSKYSFWRIYEHICMDFINEDTSGLLICLGYNSSMLPGLDRTVSCIYTSSFLLVHRKGMCA